MDTFRMTTMTFRTPPLAQRLRIVEYSIPSIAVSASNQHMSPKLAPAYGQERGHKSTRLFLYTIHGIASVHHTLKKIA